MIEYFALFGFHFLAFFIGFVVVAEKVERRVRRKEAEFTLCRMAVFKSLTVSGIARDYNIAEQSERFGRIEIEKREGKNIGGFIDAAVLFIDFPDLIIVAYRNVYLEAMIRVMLGNGSVIISK